MSSSLENGKKKIKMKGLSEEHTRGFWELLKNLDNKRKSNSKVAKGLLITDM